MQFHTPESFAHKMAAHEAYEEFRQTKDPARKMALWKESVAASERVPVPVGVMDVPTLRSQCTPLEHLLYADLLVTRALSILPRAVGLVEKTCNALAHTIKVCPR